MSAVEEPVEKVPVEEAPVEEAPVEEAPVDELVEDVVEELEEEVIAEPEPEFKFVELATPIPKSVQTGAKEIKLFNKWSFEGVTVKDISLADYIQVRQPIFVSHTAGRYANKRFRKAQCPIVERLTNSMMMNGRNNGKKLKAVRIVKHAMEIINVLTDQNPLQVIVDAIVNTGAREDTTRIGSAGAVRRQAVDVSPLRRVDQAISLLTIGAREAAFRNIKTIAECLAEELINAAKGSSTSFAIKKKDELERVAKSNR
ncbi:ribosomal protein S5 [Brettanomyces nanus]|uniref:Ribosomal protein S5 n=1 Tax=Eeniella nana TaxID=13502 RepID=A0A875RNU4_EENNA|nr:ribosomal protein S5 [Brettanomyces nanus]QPG74160.1 ribosomal protein S5 [Brettanomyces nanus]